MSQARALLALLLAAVALCPPARAESLHATLGLEYDDNPYEHVAGGRASWVSRVYVSAAGRLFEFPWGEVHLQHEWGLKRFLRSEADSLGVGDVTASQLELSGIVPVGPRAEVSWACELKSKQVHRVSSEEAYLRGGLRGGLRVRLRPGLSLEAGVRRHEDDARDVGLVDVSCTEMDAGFRWARSRRLSVRLGVRGSRLRLGRPALVADEAGVVSETRTRQRDRRWEWSAETQVYRGALIHAGYGLVHNGSNSAGYAFDAHRLQLLVARHLTAGMDARLFLTTQLRRYSDSGLALAVGGPADEYEQSLLSLELTRRCGERYDVSCQYRASRNGSSSARAHYGKQVYALALEVGI